ncbi:MAG TPA: SH3 domain-containing protein [Thermomicrobiales bacterium]|nr:SH3 domain-containing protein [Thermomicrobiales bacterium]
MGNYWEASQTSGPVPYIPLKPVGGNSESATLNASGDSGFRAGLTTPGGQLIFPVSGSSGYPGDPNDEDIPPPDSRSPEQRGRERQLDYYTEERYWTDYVRIGLPILGVILILLVALLWIIPFLNGDDDDDGTLGAGGTATTTIPVIQPSVTATNQASGSETPRITLTTQPGATTPPNTGGAPTPTTPSEAPSGEIYEGAVVAVANTGGTGVNMRATASVDGEIVTVVLDGTEFTTTGPAEEADGYVWWPVTGEAGTGYIVADFLTLVQ